MAVNRVWIEDGCIACRLCEDTCPDVFQVDGDTVIVKSDADLGANEAAITEAASNCPVEVIKYE